MSTHDVGFPVVTKPAAVPRLTVTTTMIDALDSLPAVLGRLPTASAHDVVSWVRDGNGFVGHGRAAQTHTRGPTRFEDARTWWAGLCEEAEVHDEVGLPGTGLVSVGSFAYSAASPGGATLIVPAEIFGRRGDVWWHTQVSAAGSSTRSGDGASSTPWGSLPLGSPGHVTFEAGSLSEAEWAGRVATAVDRIGKGVVDKVVLARDEVVRSEHPIDPRWLVNRLTAEYARTWVFAVDGLVGATPEMLVRTEKGLVTSRVLAGTIRRSGDDAADLALAAALARSSKDQEEHEYAVRSVAEALASYCLSMNVPEDPFVLHLPNVMHLATDVTGRLVDGAESLQLAEALHPSAAVCGTPRADADAMIAQVEGMDRGRYAGPVGWTDARGDGEWGIALRCGSIDRNDPHNARIYAGCGIVNGSRPNDEVAESQAKLLPMKTAFTA